MLIETGSYWLYRHNYIYKFVFLLSSQRLTLAKETTMELVEVLKMIVKNPDSVSPDVNTNSLNVIIRKDFMSRRDKMFALLQLKDRLQHFQLFPKIFILSITVKEEHVGESQGMGAAFSFLVSSREKFLSNLHPCDAHPSVSDFKSDGMEQSLSTSGTVNVFNSEQDITTSVNVTSGDSDTDVCPESSIGVIGKQVSFVTLSSPLKKSITDKNKVIAKLSVTESDGNCNGEPLHSLLIEDKSKEALSNVPFGTRENILTDRTNSMHHKNISNNLYANGDFIVNHEYSTNGCNSNTFSKENSCHNLGVIIEPDTRKSSGLNKEDECNYCMEENVIGDACMNTLGDKCGDTYMNPIGDLCVKPIGDKCKNTPGDTCISTSGETCMKTVENTCINPIGDTCMNHIANTCMNPNGNTCINAVHDTCTNIIEDTRLSSIGDSCTMVVGAGCMNAAGDGCMNSVGDTCMSTIDDSCVNSVGDMCVNTVDDTCISTFYTCSSDALKTDGDAQLISRGSMSDDNQALTPDVIVKGSTESCENSNDTKKHDNTKIETIQTDTIITSHNRTVHIESLCREFVIGSERTEQIDSSLGKAISSSGNVEETFCRMETTEPIDSSCGVTINSINMEPMNSPSEKPIASTCKIECDSPGDARQLVSGIEQGACSKTEKIVVCICSSASCQRQKCSDTGVTKMYSMHDPLFKKKYRFVSRRSFEKEMKPDVAIKPEIKKEPKETSPQDEETNRVKILANNVVVDAEDVLSQSHLFFKRVAKRRSMKGRTVDVKKMLQQLQNPPIVSLMKIDPSKLLSRIHKKVDPSKQLGSIHKKIDQRKQLGRIRKKIQ